MTVDNITDVALGNLLYEHFRAGFILNVSNEFPLFDYFKNRQLKGVPQSKSIDYYIMESLGHAAAQMGAAGSGDFPAKQRASGDSRSVTLKKLQTTIAVNYDEWERAKSNPAKFGEALIAEVDMKAIVNGRLICKQLWGDGTGVMGTVSSVADNTTTDVTVVTLTETAGNLTWGGSVTHFEIGDQFIAKQQDGSARAATPASGTFYAWEVVDVSRDDNTVTLKIVNSSGTKLDLTASNLAATDVFYRIGASVFPDLTASYTAGAIDMGTLTNHMMGLDGLVADDGRLVHNIAHSGNLKGTRKNASAGAFGTPLIQQVLSKTKTLVGANRVKYSNMFASHEVIDFLVNSNEGSRLFVNYEDQKRGTNEIAYRHRNDLVVLRDDIFIPKNVAYFLPEASFGGGQSPIEFAHSPIDMVVPPGQSSGWALAPASSGGGYSSEILSHQMGFMNLYTTYPASIAQIYNFTIPSI